LPDRRVLLPFTRVGRVAFMVAGRACVGCLPRSIAGVSLQVADAVSEEPLPRLVAVAAVEALDQFDWTSTLSRGVAVPTVVVDVERGCAFVGVEGRETPPVVLAGLAVVLLNAKGLEKLTPVGVVANLLEIRGVEVLLHYKLLKVNRIT